ncbi:LPS biosynthesis protein [Paenibacillus albilobatus]|uniref:LPS biosynthesis protein n=1 Tax=Paenibacillus albilobatus TaxID=2716884 RepID=A0A920CD16_9BACL|nr:rhamnan synthesis F family protein [Paenibacillus albilobatus]GIO35110.1 LPS biosynthesis protein [Paenibacillus albilobatus]
MLIDGCSKNNRVGIFFFYDEDGIVDDYITYLLNDIKKNIRDLLIVCNGKLTSDSRKKLLEYTDSIIVRENKGFDVWAYKEGIEYFGWGKLSEYDELVLFNSTMYGPLYPLKEMFESMRKKDLDFWGITKYHKMPYDPFGTIKYGYTPEHIQSHFIVVRKSMFTTYEFKYYWENMKMVNSYSEAIGFHEAIFTKEFSDKGFTWDVYVNTDDLEGHVFHPILMMPMELIKNRKCPIIKRRSFFHDTADFLNNTTGQQSMDAYDYIKNNLDYDLNLIWKNILRTNNQTDIKNALNLNYILSSSSYDSNTAYNDKKIALVMHIYFEDLIEYCLNYAKSMPPYTDVYITTSCEEKKKMIEHAFRHMECAKLEVIVIGNRGRDISALLVGCKEFLLDYDYVCFAHDKKTKQVEPYIKGEAFSYKCFENILKNREFVTNIINTFNENPRLGILSPPPPNHADFYPTIGLEWSNNFDNTKKLAEKLKLKVDMNRDKEPVAPLGTMFWFRPKALETLIKYDWEYDDFPKEPNNNDGTILHAIERIYPFVSQHEGYYPATVMVDTFARIEVTNLYYMLRQINIQYFNKCGAGPHYAVVSNLHRNLIASWEPKLKSFLKKYLPVSMINILKRLKRALT